MPCSALLVGLISNKGRVGLFQIPQKVRLFHLLWQPSVLGGNLTMRPPFLHPPKKAFLSSSVWPRREYIWTLNWKESLLICFEDCRVFPIPTGNSLEEIVLKINLCLPTPKRPSFSLQFFQEQNILGHSFERRAYWFILKATRVFSIPTQAE